IIVPCLIQQKILNRSDPDAPWRPPWRGPQRRSGSLRPWRFRRSGWTWGLLSGCDVELLRRAERFHQGAPAGHVVGGLGGQFIETRLPPGSLWQVSGSLVELSSQALNCERLLLFFRDCCAFSHKSGGIENRPQ